MHDDPDLAPTALPAGHIALRRTKFLTAIPAAGTGGSADLVEALDRSRRGGGRMGWASRAAKANGAGPNEPSAA